MVKFVPNVITTPFQPPNIIITPAKVGTTIEQ